jgi:hypothetical protein
MKVEMLRGTIYRAETLEAGRAYEVDDDFGRWLISRGKAKEYTGHGMQRDPKPVERESDLIIPAEKRIRNRRGQG